MKKGDVISFSLCGDFNHVRCIFYGKKKHQDYFNRLSYAFFNNGTHFFKGRVHSIMEHGVDTITFNNLENVYGVNYSRNKSDTYQFEIKNITKVIYTKHVIIEKYEDW